MNKVTKIVLIACAVLGALGMLLLGIGVFNNGIEEWVEFTKSELDIEYEEEIQLEEEDVVTWEEFVEDLDEESEVDTSSGNWYSEVPDSVYGLEEWSFAQLDEIKMIDIDAEYSTIHIVSSDEVAAIEVFGQKGSEEDRITATLENGVLLIVEDEVNEVVPEVNKDNSYLRITIPSGYELGHLSVESDAGLVSYNVTNFCEKFECKIDAGTFFAEQINCKYGEINVDAGTVEAKHCNLGEVDVTCETGSVKLKDVSVWRKLKLSCDVGKVDVELIGDNECYGFNIANSMGTVEIGDMELKAGSGWYNGYNEANRKVDISCDLGTVKIGFITKE